MGARRTGTVVDVQLFVLGMHRSGTSGVTRLLNMAGAYFGPEGMSNGSDEGNLKGFWERLDIRRVCNGLLQESGFDWAVLSGFSLDAIPQDVRDRHLGELRRILLELDAHRPWVIKEPRLSLLFPLVRPLLEVPVCIHVTREPLEVAASLRTRNGLPTPVGLALWELYTVHGFAASAGLPRIHVRYEDLMANPVETTARLVEELTALEVHGLRVPTEREITAFISPELYRQRRSAESRAAWMSEPQLRLAAAIDDGSILDRSERSVSDATPEVLRQGEEDRARDAELSARLESLEAELAELRDRLEATDARAAQAEERAVAADARAVAADARAREADERATAAEKESARAAAEEARLRLVADERLQAVERDVRAVANSTTYRVAWRMTSVLKALGRRGRKRRNAPLDRVVTSIGRSRESLGEDPNDAGETSPSAAPATIGGGREKSRHRLAGRGTTGRSHPTKVAVLAWDVGHNPLGRAFVLADLLRRRYDVEVWGAQFDRYGNDVWAPLRDAPVPIHVFPGTSFPEHLQAMTDIAGEIDADAIWVSKPRLPSLGLGILAKRARNRPLVLDVDDHELSFFDEDAGLDLRNLRGLRGDDDLTLPFGRAWTRACEPFIDAADALTVSNVALQDRFGGVIVPHARDERVFDPALYDRAATRRQLGVTDRDRLLLFGGTPRLHKGIVDILRALDRLGDDRYRVLLFGTREFDQIRREVGPLERWVLPLPAQAFAELPRLVGAADLACVLQNPDHPVARYQLPAKITDAMAMRVPCLVRPVPPLRSLIEEGVLEVLGEGEELHSRIAGIFDHYDDALDRAAKARKVFEATYSYEAVSAAVAPIFGGLLADPPPLSTGLSRLADAPRQVFAEELGVAVRRVPGRRSRPVSTDTQYDVVMFWKQNDSGIYGRRQDMFLKYLAKSDRVHSIVHFDRPTTPETLYKLYRNANDTADQSRLVVRHTLSRLAHRGDTDRVHAHTYLYGDRFTEKVGLRPRRRFVDYVEKVLHQHGVGERPTIFWVYPTHYDMPRVLDRLDPDIVVADIVDDQRTFTDKDTPLHDQFETNYEQVLSRTDVVLANCDTVAEAMLRFAPEVHVVPNGLELRSTNGRGPRPKELRGLNGPVLGYVGNLSQDRLDVPLLESLARTHRSWQFVFVGSAHFDRSILRLGDEPNVHFVGVKRYEETLQFIEHFDVALIPHLDNHITRSMNPLKAFVYCSTGTPVVSTPVANLSDLSGLITFARGEREFAAAVEGALLAGRRAPDREALAPLSWEMRVAQALEVIDRAVAAGR
jgi:glycosyltransferase involved in cell wall biosynthesis